LSRHYFALPTNCGEQFSMFNMIAFEEPDDYEDENLIDLEALKARTNQSGAGKSSKPDSILQSTTDATEWSLEVERVQFLGHITTLQKEIVKTLGKLSSREKFLNNELEHLVTEYQAAQSQLSEVPVTVSCFEMSSSMLIV
ncbi:IFT57 protein, partial [Amia calva]|nr:IFT57 protein [Amia calva]